jgi:hypothetical protein
VPGRQDMASCEGSSSQAGSLGDGGGACGQDCRRRPQRGGAVVPKPAGKQAGRTTGGSAKPAAHTATGGHGASTRPVRLLGDRVRVTLRRGFSPLGVWLDTK